jgi:hypothetical protein
MAKRKPVIEAKEPPEGDNWRKFRQWIGLLLAPAAWGVQLQSVYLLSENGCFGGSYLPIHLVSAICLMFAIVGGMVAFRLWRESGSEWPDRSPGAKQPGGFMAAIGILSSSLFSIVIVAQWLPTLTGVPCGM